MSNMRTKRTTVGSAGFSMIDVLVAIVVLATALLALAALQGALTRNNADARARSQVVAFSEGLIDQLRSGGYDAIASATITPSNASGATAQQKLAYNAQQAAGISGLTTTITSTAYYGTTAGTGGTFSDTAPADLTSQTPRYKQVNVTTAWTDATGQARTLSLDTAVSPLTTSSDNSLDSQSLSISGSSTPVVREYNPGATAGVIPIAIGSTEQTAATNPKPELLALNGNNSAVVGTSYNVLTYNNADVDNLSIIQQRVDTLVVSCSCKFGGPVTADDNTDFAGVVTQPYRPTYWDGTHYVDPTATSSATSPTGIDTDATQSPYCDICCRDHNDASTDTVKFDPWDTSVTQYKHYRYDSPSNAFLEVASGDTNAYLNACRLIRVGGSYAVATDLNNYFFAMLATSSPSSSATTAKSPVPDTTDTTDFGTGGATAKYQAFVLDYLQSNISNLESHTIPSVSTVAATYGGTSFNLNIPSSISIAYSASPTDYRYLHARGIYIDYLEPSAVTAVSNAITNCTTTPTSDCFLPLLPFTTINLTEIAGWSAATGSANCANPASAVSVNNQPIVDEDFNSSRGVVTARSCAASGETSVVTASIGNSNAGIAATGTGFDNPVDPNDVVSKQTDTQTFQKTGAATVNNISATLSLTPVPTSKNAVLPQLYKGYQSTYPSISWQLDSVASPTGSLTACTANATGNGGNTQLNNYSCPSIATASAAPITATMTVKLQKYNYAYTATGANPCWSGHNTTVQHCVNYAVNVNALLLNSVAVSGASVAVTNDGNVGNSTTGTTSELSTITFPASSLTTTNTVSVGFTQTTDTTTTAVCSGSSGHTATFAACN